MVHMLAASAIAFFSISIVSVAGFTQGSTSHRFPSFRPSPGQLLVDPHSITHIDYELGRETHKLCSDVFIFNKPSNASLSERHVYLIGLNLTGLQSFSFIVDKIKRKATCVYVLANGTQQSVVYLHVSRNFGCVQETSNYDTVNISALAQATITNLDYSSPRLIRGTPLYANDSYQKMNDMFFRAPGAAALLVFQQDRLVWEQYASGFNNKTLFAGDAIAFSSMVFAVRQGEVNINMSKYAHCPELGESEKIMSNVTLGNLMDQRIGHPLSEENSNYLKAKQVQDRANFAALAPYDATFQIPSDWKRYWSREHYDSSGTASLLMRELRFNFTMDSKGLEEYLAYPWTGFFSKVGASSVVMEFDPSGTFLGYEGMYATAQDYVRIARAMLPSHKLSSLPWLRRAAELPHGVIQYNHVGCSTCSVSGWRTTPWKDMMILASRQHKYEIKFLKNHDQVIVWVYPFADLVLVAHFTNESAYDLGWLDEFFIFVQAQGAAFKPVTTTTTTTAGRTTTRPPTSTKTTVGSIPPGSQRSTSTHLPSSTLWPGEPLGTKRIGIAPWFLGLAAFLQASL